jgi:hypothetical protein
VGGTTTSDTRASFSDYGTALFIAAPGASIRSAHLGNTYGDDSGTSFAAPQVSGVVGIMKALNSSLTITQIKDILKATADKTGGYNYSWDTGRPGHSKELGYGRLNAFKAIERAIGGPIAGPDAFCSTATYSLTGTAPGSVSWTATGTGINSSTGVATMYYDGFGQVYAQVTTGCGTATLTKKISTGVPNNNYIFAEAWWIGSGLGYKLSPSGNTQVEAGYAYDPIGASTILEYQWNITDHTNWYVTPLTTTSVELNYWALPNPTSQKVYIRGRNSCGWGLYQETTWEVGPYVARYTVSPNPTTDKVTLLFEDLKSAQGIPEYVELMNENSTIPVRSIKVTERDYEAIKNDGSRLSLEARDLPRGIYYLHVSYGDKQKPNTHRVILK